MKRIKYLLLLFIIIISCASPQKLFIKGNYDGAINKAVKKILKNPNSEDDILTLDKAYKLANERDLERIKYLKAEGNPNTWDEILSHYTSLKNRQSNVRRVLPLHVQGRTINYDYVDYDAEMVKAKANAAEYYYQHGKKLMQEQTKDAYRQAYEEFVRASQYTGGAYPDIDSLISFSKFNGMSRVLVQVVNNTQYKLSPEFLDNVLTINTDGLDSKWVEYNFRHVNDQANYDYYIDVVLQSIDISPEKESTKEYIEKKKLDDGFQYVLDAKGNVMRDSLGNDIKLKKYKDIQCTVIEKHQEKTAQIQGEIEFQSMNPRKLIKKEPIGANTHFEHISGKAVGDMEALTPDSKKLVDLEPVPFPDDAMMISDCTEALKNAISDVIRKNRNYIQ